MVKIFRKHITTEFSTGIGGGLNNSKGPGTALYVDTENLQGSTQTFIENIIEDWPAGTPPPRRLNLYVQADRVTLWDIWANGRFPQLTVTVRGIQHFSNRQSKNSADIAIAIDAITDFVNGVAQHVAVMSDDSDFIPLYGKLKELSDKSVPFLWLVSNRDKTRSTTIRDYFPNDHIHVVRIMRPSPGASSRDVRSNMAARPRPAVRSAPPAGDDGKGRADRMAEVADLIIEQIPAGSFRSTECQRVIKAQWPGDPMARMSSVRFGTEFANKIWPILDERGASEVRADSRGQGRSPKRGVPGVAGTSLP